MQKGPATLLLELLQQLIDFILHILSVLDLGKAQPSVNPRHCDTPSLPLPSGTSSPLQPQQEWDAATSSGRHCLDPGAETHTLAELADKECSQSGLFMVVLDVHIDHMHWLAGLLFSGVQI